MCALRVSGFFTDAAQQIHSLRASGVRLFQVAATTGDDASTFRRSVGIVCTTPEASRTIHSSVANYASLYFLTM
jgi:hypothetical protein